MSILKGLLDRIIFAAGVLLFMQVPHLIDQYEQRLGGYYQAQVNHLEKYQQIADRQHRGDLSALIYEFESSAKPSVQQTAKNVREISQQAEQYKRDVQVLANDSLLVKLSHLATTLNIEIAQAVMQTYSPAFPLSVEGLICGLVGGILLSLMFNVLFNFPNLFKAKPKPAKKPSRNHAKQRVEPTIMRASRAV